jgi:hypothetical protein
MTDLNKHRLITEQPIVEFCLSEIKGLAEIESKSYVPT